MELLWGPSTEVEAVIRTGGSSSPALQRFAILPWASRPHMLLPLESRTAAARALRLYNRLRPPAKRLARGVLARVWQTGLGPVLFRDRVEIRPVPGRGDPGPGDGLLLPFLHQLLGRDDLLCAVGIRTPGPNRKPVLEILSRAGDPVAFVKIGWNRVTRDRVRNEAAALRAWEGHESELLRVPRLLHLGEWRDLVLSVAEPLPEGVRRHRPPTTLPPIEATREIAALHGVQTSVLGDSVYWKALRERAITAVEGGPPPMQDVIEELLETVEQRHGELEVSFGTWHGDWAPWNLSWQGAHLFVLDWEHWAEPVPIGFDLLHFLFQIDFLLRRKLVQEISARLFAEGLDVLGLVDVPERSRRALGTLYLLELFLRVYEGMQVGARPSRRLFPGIVDVLEALGQDSVAAGFPTPPSPGV